MAQSTVTYDRFDLNANGDNVRESLSDVIEMISPTETPFTTNCAKATAKNTQHDWLLDTLATPSGANKQIDGDEFSNSTLTAPVRLYNQAKFWPLAA